MSTMKPRVTSFAPQFLVDDLERSIAYYQKIGFTFGEPWKVLRDRCFGRTETSLEGSAQELHEPRAQAQQRSPRRLVVLTVCLAFSPGV